MWRSTRTITFHWDGKLKLKDSKAWEVPIGLANSRGQEIFGDNLPICWWLANLEGNAHKTNHNSGNYRVTDWRCMSLWHWKLEFPYWGAQSRINTEQQHSGTTWRSRNTARPGENADNIHTGSDRGLARYANCRSGKLKGMVICSRSRKMGFQQVLLSSDLPGWIHSSAERRRRRIEKLGIMRCGQKNEFLR